MNNPFLIGQKVYLRPLEREDALTLQPWVNDPEVTRFLLVHRPMNLQAEQAFIDHVNQSQTDLALMIVRTDVDRPVGVTGLHQMNWKNRNAHFGISVGDRDCWGQGFGTEASALMVGHAFATLNLHRVTLQVFEHNRRAQAVYRKLGFREEGVLRQEEYRQGRYWDVIVMGLLRGEWEARTGGAGPAPAGRAG